MTGLGTLGAPLGKSAHGQPVHTNPPMNPGCLKCVLAHSTTPAFAFPGPGDSSDRGHGDGMGEGPRCDVRRPTSRCFLREPRTSHVARRTFTSDLAASSFTLHHSQAGVTEIVRGSVQPNEKAGLVRMPNSDMTLVPWQFHCEASSMYPVPTEPPNEG